MKGKLKMDRKTKIFEYKRELILCAAIELFKEKRFEDISIEDIAAKAELSKPTLYKYFKSKNEIIYKVFIKGYIELIPFLKEALEDETDAYEKLKKVADAYVTFFRNNTYYVILLQYLSGQSSLKNDIPEELFTERAEKAKSLSDFIKSIFDCGVENGEIYEGFDTESSTACFIGTLFSVVKGYIFGDTPKIYDDSVKIMLRAFRK